MYVHFKRREATNTALWLNFSMRKMYLIAEFPPSRGLSLQREEGEERERPDAFSIIHVLAFP